MARPPAGPIGNSPRDVRDDAVGVPADDVTAPEPPRWPPKRKKITGNNFHAKVSGSSSASRADRKPHFRKGGFVKGYASGGVIAKRDEKPGEQKNDPFAKQNLKSGGVAKRADGGDTGKWNEGVRVAEGGIKEYKRQDGGGVKKKADGGDVDEKTRERGLYKLKRHMGFAPEGFRPLVEKLQKDTTEDIVNKVPRRPPEPGPFRSGGAVKKADGGKIPDDWRRIGPEPKPPPPREEPKPGFLERELEKGRAIFAPKRPDRLKDGGVKKAAFGGGMGSPRNPNQYGRGRLFADGGDIKTWPEPGRPQLPGHKFRSESTELAKARNVRERNPNVDTMIDEIRTEDRTGPYLSSSGKYKKGGSAK